MENQELINSILDAIQANADAAKNAASLPSHVAAQQHAQAAKELAEALSTLGVKINPSV